MNKLTLGLMTIVFAIGRTQARAQDATSGPKTKTLRAKVAATFTAPVTGECVGAGFASQCPSGTCECTTDTAATVSGSMAGRVPPMARLP
jgi:hypothetical protein